MCSWPGAGTEHAVKAHLSKPFPTSHAQHLAAPCSTRQPRLPSPQSSLIARAHMTRRTSSTRASAGTTLSICLARTTMHAGREHTNFLDHAAALRVGGDCTGGRQRHPRARSGMLLLACVLMRDGRVLRRMEAVYEASMASELDQDAAPGAVSPTDHAWWQLEPPGRAGGALWARAAKTMKTGPPRSGPRPQRIAPQSRSRFK